MADRDWVQIDWNWWLERPEWAPAWLPAVDGARDPDRGLRWLRVAIAAVLIAGIGGCITTGANQPADPELGLLCAPDHDGIVAESAVAVETEPPDLLDVFATIEVTVHPGDGPGRDLCLLHADTPELRSRGLMHVTDLGGFDGMLFSFDADSHGQFYMFNTPMPLTIYWWAADGSLSGVADMEPCLVDQPGECARYGPEQPYRFALEVPQGALGEAGIDETATISVHEFG